MCKCSPRAGDLQSGNASGGPAWGVKTTPKAGVVLATEGTVLEPSRAQKGRLVSMAPQLIQHILFFRMNSPTLMLGSTWASWDVSMRLVFILWGWVGVGGPASPFRHSHSCLWVLQRFVHRITAAAGRKYWRESLPGAQELCLLQAPRDMVQLHAPLSHLPSCFRSIRSSADLQVQGDLCGTPGPRLVFVRLLHRRLALQWLFRQNH